MDLLLCNIKSLLDNSTKLVNRINISLNAHKYDIQKSHSMIVTINTLIRKFIVIKNALNQRVKGLVEGEPLSIFRIPWYNVTFGDGLVNVILNSDDHYTVKDSRSRKAYNPLRKYLINFELIIVEFNNLDNCIVSCKGLEILDDVFLRLEIEHDLVRTDLGNVENFGKYLNKLHKSKIVRLFNLTAKSEYFNFLVKATRESHKIIPVKQFFSYEISENTQEDDAYLFSIQIEDQVFVIWESVEQGQATHIFRTTEKTYRKAVQMIFDYASSRSINNKLQLLHNNRIEYFNTNVLKYIGSANHVKGDFDSWSKNVVEKFFRF